MKKLFLICLVAFLAPSLGICQEEIAFSRPTDGYWQIWTVDPEGNELSQMTHSPMDKRNPAWRLGKDQILFHTSNNELFLFDLNSHTETRLFPELGQIGDAQFTPDGKGIILVRTDQNLKDVCNLMSVDLESGKKILLTQEPGREYGPSVSPDGSRVVYVSGQEWNIKELWQITLASKEKKRLTTNDFYDTDPEFSPDGTQIAYASNQPGNYDIWTMNSDGSNLTRITETDFMNMHPTWSDDGKSLAVASQRGGNLQIWRIDLEGKEWKPLTQGENEAREPVWRR